MPEGQIGNPVRELVRRFIVTFVLAVVVYRLGVVVPIPGVDVEALSSMVNSDGTLGAILRYANMFNGGSIEKASVFGLGIMPYISASIIFTILTVSFPALKQLQKEGEVGRRKINQYTRYATVVICMVQSFLASLALTRGGQNSLLTVEAAQTPWLFVFQSVLTITTGSMVLLWLSEQVTKHGVGNGVSVIIMVGILSAMPGAINDMMSNKAELLQYLAVLGVLVAIIAAMVVVSLARRRIQLEQQRRVQGNKVMGGNTTTLPLLLNQANVIPVIFSSPVILALGFAFSWLGVSGLVDYGTAGYHLIFAILIVFFTYFYISITFDLKDVANHLKQAGFFIRGIRPGQKTVEYLQLRVNRVTFVGALSLAAIAIVPGMIGQALQLSSVATHGLLGGIGLLIVVGVTLDVIQKVGAFLMANQYNQIMRQQGSANAVGGTPALARGGKRF